MFLEWLFIKCYGLLFGGNIIYMFIEYFDVIIEWDYWYWVFCIVMVDVFLNWFFKIDRKFFNFYIVMFGNLEVFEFMYCDENV